MRGTTLGSAAAGVLMMCGMALGQSVLVLPVPQSQVVLGGLQLSGDGRMVFGSTPASDAGGPLLPWRWSAGGGLFQPALPAGTNFASWTSWSANGERALLRAMHIDGATTTNDMTVLVDGAGVTHTLTPPHGYGAGVQISGDGQTLVYGEHPSGDPAQSGGFALVSPSGTRLVALPGANAAGVSYDGTAIGGLHVNGTAPGRITGLMRWTGAEPATIVSLPAGTGIAMFAGVSPDGGTILGSLWEGNGPGFEPFRPFLFSPTHGFEFLPQVGMYSSVVSVSFDASSALVGDGATAPGLLWRRGQGSVPLLEYFLNAGVDLSAYTNLTFSDMSDDGRTFVGIGTLDGVYVPLLVTIPAPGGAGLLIGLGLCARSRRNRGH